VIHSDHGTQYASWAFTRRALDSGLVPSMGSIGDCYDNGLMESFWARMQVELLKRKRWNTRLEFANAIFEYLEIFHNRQRRHSSLGMLSPIEYELLSSETAQIGVYFAAGAPTRSTTSVSGTAPLLAGLCSLPSLFSTGEGPRKNGVRERELSAVLERVEYCVFTTAAGGGAQSRTSATTTTCQSTTPDGNASAPPLAHPLCLLPRQARIGVEEGARESVLGLTSADRHAVGRVTRVSVRSEESRRPLTN
jgi:hypothetical protein